MLVDSHCHLDFPDFDADRPDVLARARAAGVGAFVTIGTTLTGWPKVRQIAEAFDDVYCTVGIHPHEAAADGVDVDAARLIELAVHPKVVGIGETGLDYHYDHSPRDIQRRCFRSHIAAAVATGLPLVVHTREAEADTAALLAEGADTGPLKGVIHCFSASRALAERCLGLGFHISLSGIVTFKAAEDLRDTARDLPLDRLLVETDAPYLAPVPKRGRTNEPAYVVHTAARVAELKGLSPAALADATTANFFALFDRARRPSD